MSGKWLTLFIILLMFFIGVAFLIIGYILMNTPDAIPLFFVGGVLFVMGLIYGYLWIVLEHKSD